MLRAHRQAWSWQDEWVGLTMADIRRLELETQEILKRKLGRSVSISQDLEEQVEHIEEEESSTIIDGSKDDPPKRKEQSEGNECVTSPQRRHTGSKRLVALQYDWLAVLEGGVYNCTCITLRTLLFAGTNFSDLVHYRIWRC